MPGDEWQKLANLRLLFGYMFAHPGKKMLFMGNEFGQQSEWNHETALSWHLLDSPAHRGVRYWIRDVNKAYRKEDALHAADCDPQGFEWIDYGDTRNVVLSFIRCNSESADTLLAVCNF